MSQRLESTVGVQLSHGRRPRIIGWAGSCPIWSLSGSDGDGDEGNKDSQGAGDGSSGDGGSGSEGQEGTGKEGGESQDKSGESGTVSKEEYDRLMARMQAADRNKSEVERKLKEFEDKDKSELERATEEARTATETVKAKDAVIKAQAVKLAFMTSASHITWHDPADALEFAMKELSDLEVSEDGSVDSKAVKAAADKLAKDKPYLVKGNTSQSGSGSGGTNGASGASVGNGKGSDKKDLDREKLIAQYPALRR